MPPDPGDPGPSRPRAIPGDRGVVIVDGVRTPFARAGTLLRELTAHDLGSRAVAELIQRTDIDPAAIDEVILGSVCPPIETANIARVIGLRAGVPWSTPAFTVNRSCASGIESIVEAWYRIAAGTHDVIVAGGTESMSNVPFLLPRPFGHFLEDLRRSRSLSGRLGVLRRFRPSLLRPVSGLALGRVDYDSRLSMGQTAEVLAREFEIPREEQDAFSLISHERALQAERAGIFRQEIVPVFLPGSFDAVAADNGPRAGQSLETLARLRPVFDPDHGTVTAGNACPMTDGAAVLLLASGRRAAELDLRPLGRIRSFAFAGLDPARTGLGPTFSVPGALDRAGVTLREIDRIELNEAFAAQVIANERCFASRRFAREELGRAAPIGEIDRQILNVHGGAIALGHPVGATGARLVLTLLREMERNDLLLGLATLCVGGGQGAAIVLERT